MSAMAQGIDDKILMVIQIMTHEFLKDFLISACMINIPSVGPWRRYEFSECSCS